MSEYTTILLDLDGTLTDPGLGITNAVMYALTRCGVPVPERAALYKFIGPPLVDSFRDFYGFSDARAREATAIYREYYADTGLFENQVYPGIPAALQRLKDAHLRLAVATSKPEEFSRRITDRFGLTGYFDAVCGAAMDETRTQKWEVIDYALATLGITDRSGVLMVGDRKHDVLGAQRCGLPCLGVLYGYGDAPELTAAGAIALAASPAAVADYILT